MLLRFGVRNFLSFDDYQELSFMATKLRDDTRTDVAVREVGKLRILPAIVIYGANASGKSNVLAAIKFMQFFVRSSHTERTEARGISRPFFRLVAGRNTETSQLDCDFLLNGVRYHYGFEYDSERIFREWLYSFPDSRRNVLFVREGGKPMYFGPNLAEKAKAKLVEPLLRDNSLFLSAATQNNLKIAADISEWFKSSVIVSHSAIENPTIGSSKYLDDPVLRQRTLDFIKSADPTISGMEIVEEEIPAETAQFVGEFRGFLAKHLPNLDLSPLSDSESARKKYLLTHLGQTGKVAFPSELESSGTIKLLRILGPIFQSIASGNLMISDELESSLHVIIATELVTMFNSVATNPNGAQILVATHDTNLLDLRYLRRDQIWFTEKSPTGASHIYSLAELSVRKTDSIKKGYLQGRFGAIPFLPTADNVFEAA